MDKRQYMSTCRIMLLVFLPLLTTCLHGQDFNDFFTDNTLRIDYIFAGNRNNQSIFVDELSKTPRWYGRRSNLGQPPLEGNGQITVMDNETGDVLYRHSFSTLFQEWLSTEESLNVSRSFENVFLVPYPKNPVCVRVDLFDYHGNVMASMTHPVDPNDVLIRKIETAAYPYSTIKQADDTIKCINIAFIAEGYTEEEMENFLCDVNTATDALFAHEPFKSKSDRFNIVAVMSASKESGVSEPSKAIWKQTVLESHFDTFYIDRYLTTLHLKRLHDALACIPYEHIIVLVNTERYGGGGIYNSYNLSYTKGKNYDPVVVHEFGHSFGGLADEYAYSDSDPMYFSDTEPWEPNITTKADFSNKWQNLIDKGEAGMYEGGGYLTEGVWRGCEDCRMKTNEYPEFCSVCQQALARMIDFYTK